MEAQIFRVSANLPWLSESEIKISMRGLCRSKFALSKLSKELLAKSQHFQIGFKFLLLTVILTKFAGFGSILHFVCFWWLKFASFRAFSANPIFYRFFPSPAHQFATKHYMYKKCVPKNKCRLRANFEESKGVGELK